MSATPQACSRKHRTIRMPAPLLQFAKRMARIGPREHRAIAVVVLAERRWNLRYNSLIIGAQPVADSIAEPSGQGEGRSKSTLRVQFPIGGVPVRRRARELVWRKPTGMTRCNPGADRIVGMKEGHDRTALKRACELVRAPLSHSCGNGCFFESPAGRFEVRHCPVFCWRWGFSL